MTTLAARGSGTPATTGTTWASVTNAVDGAAGTNPATYTTMTNATASAVATIEITGYGFSSSIASTDTLNSVTVSLRHFENNTGRFASVRFQAFDGATAIGSQTTCTLATSARNDTATPAVTLAQLRSSTFKIVVTITGAASTQSRVESIDYVDVTADYTIAPPSITQAAYRFYADSPAGSSTLLDTYPSSNYNSNLNLYAASASIGVQSFVGDGRALTRAGFYIFGSGGDGTVSAVLYAHTGTFGSGGTGTGSVLATSTTSIGSNTLPSSPAWRYFDFDGTFTLTNGTSYCIGLTTSNTVSGGVRIAADVSPAHAGNPSRFTTIWVTGTDDLIFEVYTLVSNEATSTALAAQDTAATADTSSGDVNLQVRTRLQSTTAVAVPATDDWQLQWEKPSGVVDSLSTLVGTNSVALATGGNTQVAQSFTGNGLPVSKVRFPLYKTGGPTGDLTACIYAHSGTFGTSSLPTGAALATSSAVPVSAFPDGSISSTTWVEFEFANPLYTLAAGTNYCVALVLTGSVGAGQVRLPINASGHAGNGATYLGSWATSASDRLFEVYTGSAWTNVAASGGTVNAYNSANLTDAAATTNRLGAGSGSFVAGKISETGLVTDLGWTANNYTEVLYSVTLKQADLTPTDTLRFRVLRNAATTNMTYTQVPTITIGTAGPTDRTGTATGSLTLTGTASGVPDVTGTATGSLSLVGTAAGAPGVAPVDVVGTATGTLTVTGVTVGVRGTPGTATGALALTGTATGQKTVTATATGSLAVTGAAAGVPGVTATATGTLTLTGTAVGIRAVTGTATASLAISGTATGVRTATGQATGGLTIIGVAVGVPGVTAAATGTLALTGVASGQRTATATATGSLTVTGAASGQKTVTGTATGQVVLSSSALGLVEGNAVGTATGQLTVVGLAVGRRGTTAVATGTIAITGLATGRRTVTATVTGQVTITGTATGAVITVAVSTVNLWNGTAFVDAPVKVWNGTAWVAAAAVKTWNGSAFVDAI